MIKVFKYKKNFIQKLNKFLDNRRLGKNINTSVVPKILKDIKKNKNKKAEKSVILGELLAKRAKEKKIENVYFDRGQYKYHGRVKAFADSLRKNGLKF